MTARIPDLGGLDDLGVAVIALLVVVVVAIVVIPLLLFGIELILLGLLVATGILGRTLLGRPWIVHATPLNGEDERLDWRVESNLDLPLRRTTSAGS